MSPAPSGPRGPAVSPVLEPLLAALGVVLVSAVVLLVVRNQQAFLNFFYLPVVYAAWRMGERAGVTAAASSAMLVIGAALMNDQLFSDSGHAEWMRWLDLVVWASFLYLTAYGVGRLAHREQRRVREMRQAYVGVVEVMSKFIDSMDRSTENHSRRVAGRAVEVGRELGLGEAEVETLRVAAYLHDLGKVDVSGDLLRKAGQLTPEETEEMRRHVDYGTTMLRRVGGLLEDVVPLVQYHHERWDGAGYKGLAGEAIPIGARILAVADTYDAIVADRPYREGRSHAEAIAVLRSGRGTQFDPRVVDAFLRLFDVSKDAAEREAA